MLIALVMIWLILPVVLIPLCIIRGIEIKKRNAFLSMLFTEKRIDRDEYEQMRVIRTPEPLSITFPETAPAVGEKAEAGFKVDAAAEAVADTAEQSMRFKPVSADGFAPTKHVTSDESLGNISSAKVLFGIGTTLVILAGFVFATAIWAHLSDAARTGLIALAGLLFFGISRIAQAKLKLPSTSTAFYVISAVFFLTSFLTGSYYELFGELICLTENPLISLAVGAGILAGFGAFGVKLFGGTGFRYMSLFSIAVSVSLIFAQISDSDIFGVNDLRVFILMTTVASAFAAAYWFILKRKDLDSPESHVLIMTRIAYAVGAVLMWFADMLDGDRSWLTLIVMIFITAESALYGIIFDKPAFKVIFSLLITSAIFQACAMLNDKFCVEMIFTLGCIGALSAIKLTKRLYTVFSEVKLLSVAFIGALVQLDNDFAPYGLIALAAVLAVMLVNAFDIKCRLSKVCGALLPVPLAALTLFAAIEYEIVHEVSLRSEPTLILLAVYIACAFAFKLLSARENRFRIVSFSFELFACAGVVLATGDSVTTVTSIMAIALSILLVLEIGFKSTNIHAAIPVISVFFGFSSFGSAVGLSAEGLSVTGVILFAVFCVCSRIFFLEKLYAVRDGSYRFDLFSLAAVCSAVLMAAEYGFSESMTFFLILAEAAVLFANFVRHGNSANTNSVLMVISMFSAAAALIERPFLIVDDGIAAPKITMLIILALGLALKKVRCNGEPVAPNLGNIVCAADYIFLLLDALFNETLFNTLLVLCISIIILTASFMAKKKSPFIMSACGILGLTLYIMRDFLAEIDWWVYLLLAGILLISIAAVNEYYKDKGESVKEKAGRFFEDWKW